MTESRSIVDDGQHKLIARIRADHKSFLETLTRNEDGSITVQRTGQMRSGIGEWETPCTFLLLDKPPRGVPGNDREYIGRILREMGYKPEDPVTYSITIAPKVPEE